MQANFDELISRLEGQLPDLITPEMLLNLGLGNHASLFRIRQNGELPFIKTSASRILYLKAYVISWLRSRYNAKNEGVSR